MIKEALEYIVGLNKPDVVDIGFRTFIDNRLKPLTEPQQSNLSVNTLTGLVDLINGELSKDFKGVVVIGNPTSVCVYSDVYGCEKQRDLIYTAEAKNPYIPFGNFNYMEQFIITLQSCFIKDENRDMLLKIASSICIKDDQTIQDNGISQIATAKTGVARLEDIELPNPVTLRPYRTFSEIEQPASDFLFRINNNGQFALFEADGGAWENEAMQNVKEYLQEQLGKYKNLTVVA